MPLGPWELAIMCCFVLPLVLGVVAIVYVVQRRDADGPTVARVAPQRQADTITCPVCGTSLPDSVDFCTNCGEPRTRVRERLERQAAETGRSYEELLREARGKQQPPEPPTW